MGFIAFISFFTKFNTAIEHWAERGGFFAFQTTEMESEEKWKENWNFTVDVTTINVDWCEVWDREEYEKMLIV